MTCFGCPGGCSRCGNYNDEPDYKLEEKDVKKNKKLPEATAIESAGGGSRVYTESTCGFCRCVRREEGANGDYPPVGWADLELCIRNEGEGWTNRSVAKWMLCPGCQKKFRHFVSQQGSA